MFGAFLLATAILARYWRTGATADLEVLDRLLERTAAATAGIGGVARYERSGELTDLTAAVRLLERALKLTPRDDALRPWLLAHLGYAYWTRHAHTASFDDLDRAITYGHRAASATTADHPARSLVDRFHRGLSPAV